MNSSKQNVDAVREQWIAACDRERYWIESAARAESLCAEAMRAGLAECEQLRAVAEAARRVREEFRRWSAMGPIDRMDRIGHLEQLETDLDGALATLESK